MKKETRAQTALFEWEIREKKVGDKVKKSYRLHVHPRGIVLLVSLIVLLAAITFGVIVTVRSFVTVERYTVTGDFPYDRSEEIINVAHVETGSKMFRVSKKLTEEKILSGCAYLEDVSVRRHMNGTLEFRVQQYSTAWCFYHIDAYYTLNAHLTVMEELAAAPKNVCLVSFPTLAKALTGEKIELIGGEDELTKTEEILDTVSRSSIRSRITELSLVSRFGMKLTIDGSFHVTVGSSDKLNEKLEVLQKILLDGKLDGAVGGDIDVSNPEKVSVRPIWGRSEE